VATINKLTTVKASLQHHIPAQPRRNRGGFAAAQNDMRAFAASLLDGTEEVVEDQIEHAEMAHQLNEWFMADRNSR